MPDHTVIEPKTPPLPLPLLLFHTDLSVSFNVVLSQQELTDCQEKVDHDPSAGGGERFSAKTFSPKRLGFTILRASRHNLIAKPTGENGRPGRGGYNVEVVLANTWPAPKWNSLKASVFMSLIHYKTHSK